MLILCTALAFALPVRPGVFFFLFSFFFFLSFLPSSASCFSPDQDVTFFNFYERLLDQIAVMERGWVAKLRNNQDHFLVAGINVATQDLPQGNDKAMTKRQNAGQGCRSCNGSKEDIPQVEKLYIPRIHDDMIHHRSLMARMKPAEIAEAEKRTGILASSSPFEKISFDICMAGKAVFFNFFFILFYFIFIF